MRFLNLAGAAALGLLAAAPVFAVEGGIWGRAKPKAAPLATAPGVRVAMLEPLVAAREALHRNEYQLALQYIDEAEAQAKGPEHLSGYERYLLARMRAATAVSMGDMEVAIAQFGFVLDSPSLPADERLPMLSVLGRLSFQQRDYDSAARFLGAYREEGGTETDPLEALPQALYLAGRYRDSERELMTQIAAIEARGGRPPEHQIELLASCALKRDNLTAYRAALRRMVAYYPSDTYWMDLIARTANRESFAERLLPEVYRLRRHAGALSSAADYMQAAGLALRAGFPAEAQLVMSEGRRRGLIGRGTREAMESHKQMEAVVEREIRADQPLLEEGARLAAKQEGGDALIRAGENYIAYGEYERGLIMIREGLARGGLRHPQQAQLQYGHALFAAGRYDDALKVFSAVRGTDGTGDLAELWTILCRQRLVEAAHAAAARAAG